MFGHKPLKCFVVTQAVTAVIELDEPSCELLLQYSICGGGGHRVVDKRDTNWNNESTNWTKEFYCTVK